MNSYQPLRFTAATIGYPLAFVLLIWIVFWVEVRFGINFNYLGVQPHTAIGLRGILFTPLIHGNMEHLYSNTLPLLILSTALFYFYRGIAWRVLLFGILLSGVLTWTIGAVGSTHIGASGVVYVLASFLFFKGVWSRNYRLIALSLVVAFVYGSLLWGVLPGKEGISWEGHLAGFLSGMVLALIYRKYQLMEEKKYDWQQPEYNETKDEFMKHFDEEGNFIPSSELYADEETTESSTSESFKIRYYFKNSSENKNDY